MNTKLTTGDSISISYVFGTPIDVVGGYTLDTRMNRGAGLYGNTGGLGEHGEGVLGGPSRWEANPPCVKVADSSSPVRYSDRRRCPGSYYTDASSGASQKQSIAVVASVTVADHVQDAFADADVVDDREMVIFLLLLVQLGRDEFYHTVEAATHFLPLIASSCKIKAENPPNEGVF
ncbi:hypothetical protein U1Q18_047397 [Sarracenia purpurea var. burkii]